MVMIPPQRFKDEFLKMCRLSAIPTKGDIIDAFHEKLQHLNEKSVFAAMELIINDPPTKLTLPAFKSFMAQTKIDKPQSKWDGTACDNCDMGLILEKRDGYNFLFKCNKCKSYHVEKYEWHTQENVYKLDCKLKEIKKAREEGQTMFINRESRVN